MRDITRYDVGFTELDAGRSAAIDLNDEVALERVEHFLSARMHMPGCRDSRSEFNDADHGLLHLQALPLHVLLQDLGELGPSRLRKRGPRCGWHRGQHASDLQEFATDESHDRSP